MWPVLEWDELSKTGHIIHTTGDMGENSAQSATSHALSPWNFSMSKSVVLLPSGCLDSPLIISPTF